MGCALTVPPHSASLRTTCAIPILRTTAVVGMNASQKQGMESLAIIVPIDHKPPPNHILSAPTNRIEIPQEPPPEVRIYPASHFHPASHIHPKPPVANPNQPYQAYHLSSLHQHSAFNFDSYKHTSNTNNTNSYIHTKPYSTIASSSPSSSSSNTLATNGAKLSPSKIVNGCPLPTTATEQFFSFKSPS